MPEDLLDRKRLAERHLPLVKGLAKKMHGKLPPHVEMEDILGYGHKGLMEAAERYDPTRGVAFSTFAYYRVQGAMYDGLRAEGGLPRSVTSRFRAAERADDYLENAALRQAGADPAARARASTADTLRELAGHVATLTTIRLTSLDAELAEEIVDEHAARQLERVDNVWLAPKVRVALDRLPEKERQLIDLCYYQGLNIMEAGKKLGLSKSWASRIHARAVKKMSRYLAASGVTAPP